MRVLSAVLVCTLAGCATTQHQSRPPNPDVSVAPGIGASNRQIADYALLCASAMVAAEAGEDVLTGMPNDTLNNLAQSYLSLATAYSSKEYVQSKLANAPYSDSGHARSSEATNEDDAVAIARNLQSMQPQLLECVKYAVHVQPPNIPIP